MANTPKVDTTPLSVNQAPSAERQTPKTDFGTRMAVGAQQVAGAVGGTLGIASPYVPGGAVVTAAVAGVQSAGSQAAGNLTTNNSSNARIAGGPNFAYGATPGTGVGGRGPVPVGGGSLTPGVGGTGAPGKGEVDFNTQMSMIKDTNLGLLMKQAEMNHESQQYMSLSNIMKVRHDAAKNTIQNVH